jgi:hypothetical protein
MANFVNNFNVHEDATVANWISQINAGGTTYDIATHHSITFKEGDEETTWNGLSDLTVVIPTIQDIVQTPIEFAGTVGADGTITWNAEHSDGSDGPETGYLVFVTADCTFEGHACEAGDMAIYDGTKWNIVSGENQVQLVGTVKDNKVTVAVGAAQDVLTVEGKTLALTLDYEELNKHVETTGGKTETATGTSTVATKYLKLSKGEDSTETIGEVKTIKEATQLADGTVTITGADTLVTDVTFGTFTQGEMPTLTLNADDRTLAVTGGSLTKTDTVKDFVTDVTFGKVVLETAQDGEADTFSLVGGIQSGAGQAFVTGIDGKTEFTVAGHIKPTDGESATYLSGLAGLTEAEVVTSITDGSIVVDDSKTDFVKGFSDGSNTVIASVSSNTTTANVLSSATVKNHVLSFGNVDVVNSVTVDTTDKTLVKSGYKYTAPTAITTAFTTGGFEKTDDVTYTFNTANETTYTTTSSLYKLTTPELAVTKGGYTLSNEGMNATVPAKTFGVSMTEGTLPSLTTGSVTRKAVLTGSVATGLSTTDVTVNALKSNDITLPGVYSLVEGSADDGVAVGAAGQIDVTATVDLTSYLTGVSIVETVNA